MAELAYTKPGRDILVYCLGLENKPLTNLKRPHVIVNYLANGQPQGKKIKGCTWQELTRPGFYRLGLPATIWDEISETLSVQLFALGLQLWYFRPWAPGVERVELPTPREVQQQIKSGEMKPKGTVIEAPEFSGSRKLRLDLLRERS